MATALAATSSVSRRVEALELEVAVTVKKTSGMPEGIPLEGELGRLDADHVQPAACEDLRGDAGAAAHIDQPLPRGQAAAREDEVHGLGGVIGTAFRVNVRQPREAGRRVGVGQPGHQPLPGGGARS